MTNREADTIFTRKDEAEYIPAEQNQGRVEGSVALKPGLRIRPGGETGKAPKDNRVVQNEYTHKVGSGDPLTEARAKLIAIDDITRSPSPQRGGDAPSKRGKIRG